MKYYPRFRLLFTFDSHTKIDAYNIYRLITLFRSDLRIMEVCNLKLSITTFWGYWRLLSYIETQAKADIYIYIYRTYMFIRNPGRSNMDWNSFLKSFSAEIWAALPVVILVLSACIFIDSKIGRNYGNASGNTSWLRLCDSLLYVYYSFCQQSKYSSCFNFLLSVWAECHDNICTDVSGSRNQMQGQNLT
jgi:hypothetical protein